MSEGHNGQHEPGTEHSDQPAAEPSTSVEDGPQPGDQLTTEIPTTEVEPTEQLAVEQTEVEPTQQLAVEPSAGDIPVPVISTDRSEPTEQPPAAVPADSATTADQPDAEDVATQAHPDPLYSEDAEATQELDAQTISHQQAQDRLESRRAGEAAGYQYANYYRPQADPDPEPAPEPTQVLPASGLGAGAGAAGFASLDQRPSDQESDEERQARIREDRERERRERAAAAERRADAEQERQRALGVVTPGGDPHQPTNTRPPKRTTDKWFGSLGLFVLRLVTAAILGVRGYQMVTDIPGTRELLTAINMPYLNYLPWGLAIALLLGALALVFGFGVRLVGVCVTALAVCTLALVRWGTVPIFQADLAGFVGELEVLLAAVGFTLVTLGGGRWGLDGGIRDTRMRTKYGEG